MRELFSRFIGILLIIAIIFLALIEVYPTQMIAAENKVGISVVQPTQDFIDNIKDKILAATNKDYQQNIKDMVNDEMNQ